MDETANQDGVQDQQEVRDSVVEEKSSVESSQPHLSYDTYKRTVGEVKKVKSQLAETQERLKVYEQREMEQKGQTTDLINALRAENKELKAGIQERDNVYSWSRRSNSLRESLAKNGCRKPEHLLRLMDEDVFNQIQVDDDYNPVTEDVDRIVENYKGNPEYGYLFESRAVNVDTVNPASKIEKPAPKSLREIPIDERIRMLELNKKSDA